MKIVIDIPEKYYNTCKKWEEIGVATLEQAIIGKGEPYTEQPHGEWLSHYEYCKKHEYLPTGLITFWWCNQCEQGVEIATNFCPNCGSDNRPKGGSQE